MLKIDESSFKTLKVIYKHPQITRELLKRKFPRKLDTQLDLEIYILQRNNFIKNAVIGQDNIGNQITDQNTFFITQEGKVYIETCMQDKRRWLVPVILSGIALVFSALALINGIVTTLIQIEK